jgi:Flp pilus assembly protein TadG
MRNTAQALVEFAFAVVVFLIVVLGLIDFARLLFTYVSVSNGVRELARVASIARSSSVAVVAAFNNYTILGAGADPSTDRVVVTVTDESCVSNQRQSLPCVPGSVNSATCALPLQSSCAVPSRSAAGGGYVQVDLTYSFVFDPLFQSLLGNSLAITTTAQSDIE